MAGQRDVLESRGFTAGDAEFGGPLEPQTPSIGTMGSMGPEGTNWRNFICRSSHPFAAFFHLAFKMSALVLYLFGTLLFGMDYVTLFVMSVLLLAFDFWTVKNVSGRLLVGLRWWVSILPNGTNEWQFESAPNNQVPALDYRIFWWALYLAPLVWGLLGLLAFISLKLDWLLITLVGAGLTGANLVGYYRCSSDAQKKLQSTLTSGAMAGLSYFPGAIPALGNTLVGLIRTANSGPSAQAAAPVGATAPSSAAGAGGDAGAKDLHNPFPDEKVTI